MSQKKIFAALIIPPRMNNNQFEAVYYTLAETEAEAEANVREKDFVVNDDRVLNHKLPDDDDLSGIGLSDDNPVVKWM